MRIFHGRPLAVLGAVFAAAAVAGVFHSALIYIITASSCAAFAASAVIMRRRGRISRYRLATGICAALMISLFCLRCFFFFVADRASALRFAGDGKEVCGVVEDRVSSSNYSVSYNVRLCFVDREECDVRALLECSFSCPMQDGDLFVATGVSVCDSETVRSSLARDGRYLCVNCSDSYSVRVTGREERGVASGKLASRLAYLVRNRIGGAEGGLCSAMLLGDRSSVDQSTELAFRRAGISHLLAVSGLHLTILTGILSALLRRVRLRKRLMLPVLAAFVAGYAALLGFPVSATRSAVMLLICYGCLLSGFESDGISALGLAVCVILSFRPGAVADIGFILSVCGTLGLFSKSGIFPGKENGPAASSSVSPAVLLVKKAAAYAGGALFAVLCANMLTTLPVALVFGEISKAAPISNLIFPPAAGFLLFLLLLLIITLPFPFLPDMIAFYARKTASLMISAAKAVSDIEGVTASLRMPLTLAVIIASTVLTLVFLTVSLKRRYITVMPYIIALSLIIFADGAQYPARVGCVSLSVGNGEAFCAAGGGKAVIIDISAGNYSPVSAAYEAAASLGATETAALVLTHYHVRHIGTVSRFMAEHKVRSVYLPEPVTSKDASVALSLADAAEIAGVPAFVYSSFEDIDVFGGITLCLSGPLRIDRSTHPVLAFSLRSGSRSIVWFGRSSWESFEIASNLKIDEETTVLAGLHGPVIKS
ncbi:MAG: ComEC/Rec2 family competence protein, partial [Clostridia bacterium]|nr:ComEC/Rec2 family competence protein [Clostridia bacterium]